MAGSMMVHLYKVQAGVGSIPLVDQLRLINAVPLEDRSREVSKQLIRLEFADEVDGAWLMDFGKIRFNSGPGKASVTSPIVGFDMEDDEGFGEETAALYNPALGYIAVQYNHIGVRHGTMAEYLSTFDLNVFNGYQFAICFDPDVEGKLAAKEFFRKLHFSMNFGKMSPEHRAAGLALRDVIALENTFNAGSIEVIVRMPRGGDGLSLVAVRDAINYMRGIRDDENKSIPKLQVFAGNDADASAEVLDLVSQRIVAEYGEPDLVLGQDKRYTRESRFNVLIRAMRGWQRFMER
ncbi:DUF6731 family protein [Chromobacterium rhizoryzae]|uniref:DUF6731 family protein n=1 Tax=Chromobacterium rhizoryzae TaxID=1778675 RepID=UPI001D08FE87|nr:DUF6731 family protein [Chromobacterium rhizoryzae]